jgi:thiol-disulfide isomerase/thioredoxin
MFFAPDCPLCKNYSKPFNQLVEEYPSVQFFAIHSGRNYEAKEIQMFARNMKLKMPVYRDYDYDLANQLGAQITPEFFLLDSSGTVLYQGLLDDRMKELGVYRQNWSNHFLQEAISSSVEGEPVKVTKTEAVGCVLEY